MKMNPQKRYLCVGENYREDVPIGDCGETKTLMESLKHLYPTTNLQILKDHTALCPKCMERRENNDT